MTSSDNNHKKARVVNINAAKHSIQMMRDNTERDITAEEELRAIIENTILDSYYSKCSYKKFSELALEVIINLEDAIGRYNTLWGIEE